MEMFGSISWFGEAITSQCETEEPSLTGSGAYMRGRPCGSLPCVNSVASLWVCGPVQTRLPVLMAEDALGVGHLRPIFVGCVVE